MGKEAAKNWDIFYKRNKANFFKDRHYLTKEFSEVCGDPSDSSGQFDLSAEWSVVGPSSPSRLIFEVGCGVGNAIVPMIQTTPGLNAVATDCATTAIQLLRERASEEGLSDRITAEVLDATD